MCMFTELMSSLKKKIMWTVAISYFVLEKLVIRSSQSELDFLQCVIVHC